VSRIDNNKQKLSFLEKDRDRDAYHQTYVFRLGSS
jgi:hypothetical protein